MRRWLVRLVWAVALFAAAVFAIQAFVCDVYRVDSGSMEPVLHGPGGGRPGEAVLVLYGRRDPRRFELVVLRRPDEELPIVKRIAGLPGESVLISGGDLLIDGERLGADVPRPEPITVFDERVQPLERAFPELAQTATRRGDAWSVQAAAGETLEFAYAPRITDGYLDAANEWIDGDALVNDLGVRVDVRLVTPDAELTIELTEEGDRYRARFAHASEGVGFGVFRSRERPDGSWEPTSSAQRTIEGDAWHEARIENVDNVLLAYLGPCGGAEQLAANRPLADAPDPNLKHRLPRVTLRVAGTVLLRHLRIVRDRYWVARGTHGVVAPVQLGPDEVFVLGDRSAESFDSRQYGPVKLSDLLGRPAAVVWPRLRSLPAPRPLTGSP